MDLCYHCGGRHWLAASVFIGVGMIAWISARSYHHQIRSGTARARELLFQTVVLYLISTFLVLVGWMVL